MIAVSIAARASRRGTLSLGPVLLLIASLSACGSGPEGQGQAPAAAILGFEADPDQLDGPGTTTLSWVTENARALSLARDGAPIASEALAPAGSIEVEVERTTVFELRAEGAAGEGVSAQLTVVVEVTEEPPTIGGFSGPDALTVDAQGRAEATLRWEGVEGAEELLLEAGEGAATSLEPIPDGSIEVELVEDTSFTLVARNGAGESRATHAIRLVAPPSVDSLVADRTWVGLADPVELSWSTTGAVAVELWIDGVEEPGVDRSATTGTAVIFPNLSAEVELRAYNEVGAEARRSLSIEVARPKILSATASATTLWLGESLQLGWESAGAREVEVIAEGVATPICSSQDRAEVDESSCEWQPPEGDFLVTLSFVNGSGVESVSFSGWVGTGPRLLDLWVSPLAITVGDEIELGWAASPDPAGQDPTLDLSDDRGGVHPISGASGSLRIPLDEVGPWEFRLEASTEHPLSERAEASVQVLVHGQPLASLEADPPFFDDTEAEEVSLRWTSEHAARLVLFELVDGAPVQLLEIPEAERAAGAHRFVPSREADYRLVAWNELGISHEVEASVRLAPPRVLEFVAAESEIAPGEAVLLRWDTSMGDEVSLSFFGEEYVRGEIPFRYEDISQGGTPVHLGLDCSTTPLSNGCAQLDFPEGFTFPFGGTAQRAVRVHNAGFLSFDLSFTGSATFNNRFPTPTDYEYVHIAPFWDSLTWNAERYPQGNIHARLDGEEGERQLTIQWKDVTHSSNRAASLNFQVVLHEDGRFEFRYADMDPGMWVTDTQREVAEGRSATIGYQTPGQTASDVIQHNQDVMVRGRLDGRAFAYTPTWALPATGSLLWYPYADGPQVEAELVVRRGELSDSAKLTVEVLERPAITMSDRPTAPVPVGAPFRLGWMTTGAHSLVLLDGDDDPRCTAADQLEVEEGFCTLSESAQGVYEYRLRVEGERGAVLEKPVTVLIQDPFGIVSFTADEERIELGDPVTLSWETQNAAQLHLLRDGVELQPGGIPAQGSLVLEDLREDATFVLRAISSLGQVQEVELVVEVVSVRLELSASADRIRPGEAVTITVEGSSLGGGPPPPLYGTAPLVEVEDAPPYQDISTLPGATKLPITGGGAALQSQYSDLPLPSGFDFPYFGEVFRVLRIFHVGLVSFESPIAHENNRLLPDTGSTFNRYHLAPFWDALVPNQDDAGIWAAQTDPYTFVIQWKNFSSVTGSQRTNAARSYSLNFQLALSRDGSFEYRYGTMAPPQNPVTGCQPASCVAEANGSSATIGYQARGGTMGLTHHFGGATSGADNPPYPGGLSNRTLRYSPIESGAQLTFHPVRTSTYTFCAASAQAPICKQVEVEAPFGIESFEADQERVDFGGTTTLRWVTVGGTTLRIRDGEGAELATTDDPAAIDAGALQVSPTTSTTYTLELLAADRRVVATAAVEVVRMRVENVGPATTHPGEPITLSWTLDVLDPALEPVLITPMEEVSGPGYRFEDLDLSKVAGATPIPFGSGNATPRMAFEPDFSFDYLGTRMSSVGISPNGALTFDTGTGAIDAANVALPNLGSPGQRLVHLAPFWDQLRLGDSARGYMMRTGPDTYVIQWSRFSVHAGSSQQNQYDLNFMVVLHRGGDFEFRYGVMEPPSAPSIFPACATTSCVHEANGSTATIGYQAPGGEAGFTLHHGSNASQLRAVAGGLSGRSWRYTRSSASTGSVQVAPWDSTTYRICALDPATGDAACGERIDVEAPWGIAAFEADPSAFLPPQTVRLRWEVRGLDRLRLLADGAVLLEQSGASIDPLGSFEHSPTATTTYVLEGTSAGRILEEVRVVERRTLSLEFTSPPGRHFPGDEVSLSWTITTHEPGEPTVEPPEGVLEGPLGTTGSVKVEVGAFAEDHTLCASLGDFRACETLRLAPVAEPGDLAITELMIDPAGGKAHQWFEIRNLRPEPLDLAGFELTTSRARHPIVAPLVIAPGEFALFAASAAALPAHPSAHVPQGGLELHPRVESLAILAGDATIASASWDIGWVIPSGGSLSLDASHHLRGIAAHSFASWCRGSEIPPSPGALGPGCRSEHYDLDAMGEGAWIDLSLLGQEVRAFETPSQVVELEVPGFGWTFFGQPVERVWAAGNGWISFAEPASSAGSSGPPSLGGIPRSLPAQPPGPLIAGFWSTLRCDPFEHPCAFRYHHGVVGGAEVLILEWSGFRYSTLPGELSFQIQLWEGGDVKVVFGDVWSADPRGSVGHAAYRGNAAVIYLEGERAEEQLVANHRRAIDLAHRVFHFKRR